MSDIILSRSTPQGTIFAEIIAVTKPVTLPTQPHKNFDLCCFFLSSIPLPTDKAVVKV